MRLCAVKYQRRHGVSAFQFTMCIQNIPRACYNVCMRLQVDSQTVNSGSKFILAACLSLYIDGPVWSIFQKEPNASTALVTLASSTPTNTKLQQAINAAFPRLTSINLYIGVSSPQRPSHYISLVKIDGLWRPVNRSVRRITHDNLPRSGVLVCWGNYVPMATKAAQSEPKIKILVSGKSTLTDEPAIHRQISTAIQILNLVQKKTKPILTIWGNPGKIVYHYKQSQDFPPLFVLDEQRSRYGATPTLGKFPVVVHGSAEPVPGTPPQSSPTCVCVQFSRKFKRVAEDHPHLEYRYLLAAALDSCIHPFISTVIDDKTTLHVRSYDPDLGSYEYVKLPTSHTFRNRPPTYLWDGDRWMPNDIALAQLIGHLLHSPDLGPFVKYLFSLLALKFDFDSIMSANSAWGIVELDDDEAALLEKRINSLNNGDAL